jgi:indole-3-glycerol phosphate synthase
MGLLTDMYQSSLRRAAEARERVPEGALRAAIGASPVPPALVLEPRGFDVIAELKLRSPSMGDLSAATADPSARLEAYARGGAAVISVLTEPSRFGGETGHLRQASETVRRFGVPVMRKDFLVDPYQVLEARAFGASGVLLIVRMASRDRLVAMLDCAEQQGLFVLLETFDAADLEIACDLARDRRGRRETILVGLNCRDLETLQIDFARFERLRDRMPDGWPTVAESGVQTVADAARIARLGYRLALVGTSLMQHVDPQPAVEELLAAGRSAVD